MLFHLQSLKGDCFPEIVEDKDAYQKWKTDSEDTAPERDGEISGWQFFMNLPMWMRIGLIMRDIVIIGALAYFFLI